MKIMINEIKSDFDGARKSFAENGQMVDFGQKLFAIQTWNFRGN